MKIKEENYSYFTNNNKIYMVVIALFILLLLWLEHYEIALISLVFYLILVVYNVKNSKVKNYEWKKFIENISSKMDIATTSTLSNLPFPLIMVSGKGNILWYNQNISVKLDGRQIIGENIKEIVKEFNIKQILEGKRSAYTEVNIGENYYDIYVNVVDTEISQKEDDKILLLYFYEVTEKVKLIKDINDNKESVILIEVDNLDDVVKKYCRR